MKRIDGLRLPLTAMVLKPPEGYMFFQPKKYDILHVTDVELYKDGQEYVSFDMASPGWFIEQFAIDPLYRPLKSTKRTQE